MTPARVSDMKQIAVVAAVIESSGRILCVKRPANKYLYISHKWEFPGGKIEEGESKEDALEREISEELAIDITIGDPILTVEHQYPDFHITMHALQCALASSHEESDVELTEHVDLRWISRADPAFSELDWAAADVPIVNALVLSEES